MGSDDGIVRDAGDLLGTRLGSGDGRVVLHSAGPARPIRVDGATGNVYQIAADNLTRLQEEIYRVCYVSHAGGAFRGMRRNRE